ncbi:GntR family transcriptional regulator [Nonomuraea phyllanthi]|uniref:FadR/GntR family transcriptional regulator n=1 Tax=Nonomuraea phyllanthi TaxID=2219224 RepID=UPI001293B812|nr:FCD domain-containing protein [Nonomuraea phyllanthi]QFY10975.1 GntR family transcriptional regulator [Nonomuraea phyllanthi]
MSRRPIYREAQARLKEYIQQHGMRPGDRLPAEAVLAAELGVSRPSLREATKSLQTLGVIEAQHGNGLFVAAFSFRPIIEQLPYGLVDSDAHFAEILVAREAMEVGLMHFAARLGAGAELEECERLARVMEEREAAGESSADVDKQFHLMLYRGLHNSLVDQVIETFWEMFSRLGDAIPRAKGTGVGAIHLAVVHALRAGDAQAAAASMRAHFDDVRARAAILDPGAARTGVPQV